MTKIGVEQLFHRSNNELEKTFEFIDRFFSTELIPVEFSNVIKFIVEELFTNMVKYNPTGESPIRIMLTKQENKVVIVAIDAASKPFDVTKAPEAETTLSLEERKIGGLGIYLIRKMVDEAYYEYGNGMSKTTLVKYLENQNVDS